MKTSYREAMREAIREAMRRDDRVFLMGEDVGHYGGCYAVSLGLLEEFGPERIRDTPLSESGFVGAELLEQPEAHRVAAAVVPDVLAHEEDPVVALHRLADRLPHGLAVAGLHPAASCSL